MDLIDSTVKLLVTQQHSRELYGRHVAAIEALCRDNPTGFAVRDLPRIVQVLQIAINLISSGESAFVQPVCCLIRTLSKPYIRRSSTDELKLLGNITGLLETLKHALTIDMPDELQACTAQFMTEFASAYHTRPQALELIDETTNIWDLRTVQRLYHTHQSLLADNHMAETVCSALQNALDTVSLDHVSSSNRSLLADSGASCPSSVPARTVLSSLAVNLLETATEFSHSAELCQQLLHAGVLASVVRLLELVPLAVDTDVRLVKATNQVIELLWNLFELAPAAAADVLTTVERPKAAAAAATAVANDGQGTTQPCTAVIPAEPWVSRTEAGTPQDANMWTRSSPCASTSCSRPDSVADNDNMQAENQHAACGATAAVTQAMVQDDVRAATAQSCWPGSMVATPNQAGGQQLPHLVASLVDCLVSLLEHQMQHSHSLQDKEARNDTLAVIYHLSGVARCSSVLATSTFTQLAMAATGECPDLQGNSNHLQGGSSGHSGADLEMQLLFWSALGRVAVSSLQPLHWLADSGLLLHLMSAITDAYSDSSVNTCPWNREQMVTRQKTAWSVLQQVAPLCKEAYCNSNGVAFLMNHLSAYCSSSVSIGTTGHSGLITPSSSVEPALRLLQRLVTADKSLSSAFIEAGVVSVLLQLLLAPGAADAEPARAGVLLVLAELCETVGSDCREQLRQADAVGLLMKECQEVLANKAIPPGLLDLAALNAVWRCCLPSGRCRAQFLALNGVDLLLELLQYGNKDLRPVILSMLSDLLQDRRSHPFFLEWHSPCSSAGDVAGSTTGTLGRSIIPPWCPAQPARTTAAQLLLRVWRDQEKARGLTREDGILSNITRPLAGSADHISWCVGGVPVVKTGCTQENKAQSQLQSSLSTANSPDLLMNKVYACFAQLDCDTLATSLPPTDAATLVFIRQYVKFRQGEVWQDIKQEFEAAGLSPTQEDKVRVISGIHHAEHTAGQVIEQQRVLLSTSIQEQRKAEKALYDSILAQAAADAKAKVYEKDSSKLTMRERLAAKARKEDMLKNSLANSLSNAMA